MARLEQPLRIAGNALKVVKISDVLKRSAIHSRRVKRGTEDRKEKEIGEGPKNKRHYGQI